MVGGPALYGLMLKTTLVPLGLAAVIWLVIRSRRAPLPHRQQDHLARLPLHEIVAAAALLSLPVIGLILAKLVTGVFTERYALPAVIGCSILFAFAAHRLSRGSVVLGRALALCLLGWFGAGVLWQFHEAEQAAARLKRVGNMLGHTSGGTDSPIVAADEISYLQLAYYLPPDLAKRLVCVGNGKDNLRLKERLQPLQPSAVMNLEDYGPFMASHPRFFVIKMSNGWGEWLVPALLEDGRQVVAKAHDGADVIYAVETAP